MIKIEGLNYLNILKINHMEISADSFYILSGPSGSGKTSLFNLFLANTFDYQGQIYLWGQKVKGTDTQKIRDKIGFVSQEEFLFTKTIKMEFDYICQLFSLQIEDYQPYLDLVCLDKDINSNIDSLSGGEKQRLVLARLLMIPKMIYLLDEPTSALDEPTAHRLINNLINFQKKEHCLIIMTTHNESIKQLPDTKLIFIGGNNESNSN